MNKRDTKQKQIVYEALLEHKDHPTNLEIYEELKNKGARIGKTTVYRILNNLVQEDKLRRINTFDNVSHCDYVLDDHIHFVCEKCNKIYDLENTNDLKDALKEMDVSHNNLLIYGICSGCKGG
ncbi:MAG: transcriptional repressor [Bacilli bacterium]|nr:transcriptional repressor [Bacilli bacterium]